MKNVIVKPSKEGLYVCDESGNRIPAEGCAVPFTTFISRSIKAGALIVVEPEKEQAETVLKASAEMANAKYKRTK